MTGLAMMHIAGKEDEEAARWFRRGAEVGDLAAQHDYALLLLQGRGVIKDEQAATRWYSAAAAQGGKSCYLPLAELMQAERELLVTPLKPTRLRLSLRLFLTTATCSAFAWLN